MFFRLRYVYVGQQLPTATADDGEPAVAPAAGREGLKTRHVSSPRYNFFFILFHSHLTPTDLPLKAHEGQRRPTTANV